MPEGIGGGSMMSLAQFQQQQQQHRDKMDSELNNPINLFGSPPTSFSLPHSAALLSSSPGSRSANPMDYHRLSHPAIAQWLQQAHLAQQQQQQQMKDEPNDDQVPPQRGHRGTSDYPEI